MMLSEFLTQLRASCETRHIPLISPESEHFIRTLLQKYQPKTCLEIGSAVGYSSIVIASVISEWWGQLTSFEVAYPAYLEAQRNIHEAKCWNTTLYPFDITKSETTASVLPVHCDFVFIDAQKNQYGNYLEKIQGNLSSENIILLDDVVKYQTKLTSLYQFLEKNQINYEIFPSEEGDGVMLLKNI